MATKTNMLIGVAVVIVVAVVAVSLIGGTRNLGILGGTVPTGVPILLTDPPHVPNGTTALDANYSSVAIFYTNGTQSGWINAQGSGSVDLLSLVNVTELVASANVPNGSVVSRARFNITAATITINGTSYPVTTPNPQIIANVSSAQTINGNSSILVDLSPTIITVFTNNQTLFIMVPSVKAILVGNQTARVRLHQTITIPPIILHKLTPPNITITGASLSVSGNTTTLSVTVKNNANTTVYLNSVQLYGNETYIVANSPCPWRCPPSPYAMCPACIIPPGQVNATANVSAGSAIGSVIGQISSGVRAGGNLKHGFYPSGYNSGVNGYSTTAINVNGTIEANFWRQFRDVDFLIQPSGNLILPYDRCVYEPHPGVLPGGYIGSNTTVNVTMPGALVNGQVQGWAGVGGISTPMPPIICAGSNFGGSALGFSLQPGQSATLQFTGQISLGYGLVDLKPIAGQTYEINVFGAAGAHTRTNVTAA
jgi:hypothetical protein